ncbi:MAG: hypothetical protein JTT11_09820 [Candidatus Brockarchaeota archaeon]|nr:hypothetical protein [Candidatus Brockarchaeota archaeon]
MWIHGERVTAVEAGEGGSVYLLYKKGDRAFRVPIKVPSLSEAGEKKVRLLAKTPEEVLLLFLSNLKTKRGDKWQPVLDQQQIDTLRKISDKVRLRSFIEEIRDYERLGRIVSGEAEISGFNVGVEKVDGDGKGFYQLEILETASVMRVYEDGTIAVKREGKFWRLDPESLKIDKEKPIDESTIEGQ